MRNDARNCAFLEQGPPSLISQSSLECAGRLVLLTEGVITALPHLVEHERSLLHPLFSNFFVRAGNTRLDNTVDDTISVPVAHALPTLHSSINLRLIQPLELLLETALYSGRP